MLCKSCLHGAYGIRFFLHEGPFLDEGGPEKLPIYLNALYETCAN